jgi:hypothetical protein
MNRLHNTFNRHIAGSRRECPDFRNFSNIKTREAHRNRIERPQLIRRLCPDWFAMRMWEDDGGGVVAD